MKTKGKYLLEGTIVVPCDDLIEWATKLETMEKQLALTVLDSGTVSTIFIGIDMNYSEQNPRVFETMIFYKDDCNVLNRYQTWDEAMQGHAEAVKQLIEGKQ